MIWVERQEGERSPRRPGVRRRRGRAGWVTQVAPCRLRVCPACAFLLALPLCSSTHPLSPTCARRAPRRRLGARAAARLWRARVAPQLVCQRQRAVGVRRQQRRHAVEGGHRRPVAANHAVRRAVVAPIIDGAPPPPADHASTRPPAAAACQNLSTQKHLCKNIENDSVRAVRVITRKAYQNQQKRGGSAVYPLAGVPTRAQLPPAPPPPR